MTSPASIEPTGIRLALEGREHFIPFAQYSAFLNATVEQVFHFERPRPTPAPRLRSLTGTRSN